MRCCKLTGPVTVGGRTEPPDRRQCGGVPAAWAVPGVRQHRYRSDFLLTHRHHGLRQADHRGCPSGHRTMADALAPIARQRRLPHGPQFPPERATTLRTARHRRRCPPGSVVTSCRSAAPTSVRTRSTLLLSAHHRLRGRARPRQRHGGVPPSRHPPQLGPADRPARLRDRQPRWGPPGTNLTWSPYTRRCGSSARTTTGGSAGQCGGEHGVWPTLCVHGTLAVIPLPSARMMSGSTLEGPLDLRPATGSMSCPRPP